MLLILAPWRFPTRRVVRRHPTITAQEFRITICRHRPFSKNASHSVSYGQKIFLRILEFCHVAHPLRRAHLHKFFNASRYPMKRAFLAFLLSITSLAWSADKDSAVSSYVSILQQLQQLARGARADDPQPKLRASIDSVLPSTLSSEQLYRLGVGAYLLAYPGEAGPDVPFDRVFHYASFRCAELLSKRADWKSAHYLRSMKPICGSDAGESLQYLELIEEQEKLLKKAKPK